MNAAKVTLTDAERDSIWYIGASGDQQLRAVESIVAARVAEAMRDAADVLVKNGPVLNYELNPDGTEDRERAAYVEGHRDSVMALRSFADEYAPGADS